MILIPVLNRLMPICHSWWCHVWISIISKVLLHIHLLRNSPECSGMSFFGLVEL